MTKREEPRRARVDGEDVVVLMADDYDLWVPKTSSAAVEDGYLLGTCHSAV
jgi:hypothetical protein